MTSYILLVFRYSYQRRQRLRNYRLKIEIHVISTALWLIFQLDELCAMGPNYPRVRICLERRSSQERNKKFTLMCVLSLRNLKFGHFTLSFCRGRQWNVPKCITYVQRDCFCTLNRNYLWGSCWCCRQRSGLFKTSAFLHDKLGFLVSQSTKFWETFLYSKYPIW